MDDNRCGDGGSQTHKKESHRKKEGEIFAFCSSFGAYFLPCGDVQSHQSPFFAVFHQHSYAIGGKKAVNRKKTDTQMPLFLGKLRLAFLPARKKQAEQIFPLAAILADAATGILKVDTYAAVFKSRPNGQTFLRSFAHRGEGVSKDVDQSRNQMAAKDAHQGQIPCELQVKRHLVFEEKVGAKNVDKLGENQI